MNNESSIKAKIFLYKSTDLVLFIVVFGWGIYATIHAENRPLIAITAMAALFVVNLVGRWSYTQVAILKGKLREIERLKPKF